MPDGAKPYEPGAAKFQCPQVGELFARTRLLADLDRGIGGLTWIVGPAGSGKTSLIGSWVAAQQHPVIWYRVDETDSDPASVFLALTLALRGLPGKQRVRLPVPAPEHLANLAHFSRRFMTAYVNALPARAILVFDNCHEAQGPAQGAFAMLLGLLLQERRTDLTVLASSRTPPAPLLQPWLTHPQTRVLGWAQLRLDREESFALATRLLGHAPDPRQVEMADGWAAALVLLSRLSHTDIRLPGSPQGEPAQAFAALAAASLESLPAPARRLLAGTAFANRLTASLAAQCAQVADAADQLAALWQAHFFVERSISLRGEPVYRFHPLLQAYLRQQVRHEAGEDEVRRQCSLLADWHEAEHGEFGEAALLHAEAGQWGQFVRLLTLSAGRLMATGQVSALMALLARMPQAEADGHPVIAYWRGIVWLPRDLAAGREQLLGAHAQATAGGQLELAALAMAALVESAMFDWQWREALTWVVELDQLCERLGHRYSSVEIEARILSCAAAAMFPAPDHPLVQRWLARARDLVLTLEEPQWRLSLARFVIGYLWWQGEPRTTRRLVTELLPIAESGAVSAAAAIELLIWCGIASSSDGDRTLAARCFDQAQRLGTEQGIAFFDFHIALQRVVAAIGSSDTEGAERAYAALIQLAPMQGVAGRFLMELTRPGLLMHRGDIDAAMESALASMQALDDGGWVYGRATHQHATGQIALLANRPELARGCFERALAFGRRMPSHFLLLMAQLMLALLDHDQGDRDSARARLAEGLGLARRLGYRHLHPYWMPTLFARVFELALANGIETSYVRHLLRLNPLPAPAGAVAGWPYAVRLRLVGAFAIEIDGQTLAGRRKGQLKVLELIKAMAAHGHEPVPVTWLIDALWPDADGDVARDNFDVCLHRARKLLRVRDALALEEGRLRLHPGWVWIDAQSMTHSLARLAAPSAGGGVAEPARVSADLADGRVMATRWLTDFRGPVFDGETPPAWMLGLRESWHRRLGRSAVALAQACRLQGHGGAGEAVLRRWLEAYPHDEQAERELATSQPMGRLPPG